MHTQSSAHKQRYLPSRRKVLHRAAATGAAALIAGAIPSSDAFAAADGADLQPRDPLAAILDATQRFPLVALGERHQLQEWHDLLTALLLRPELPGRITDIVVEFGNALHQDIADRFILGDHPTANADLATIWRYTIGGGVLWDAPVYEHFFRTVRAVNWMLPPSRRLRVLLGDPPFDHRKVRSAADRDYVLAIAAQRDAYYAGVVDREVLRKERRALLLAGSGHLLHGIHANTNPQGLNAATLLMRSHPNAIFVVDLLIVPPGHQQDGHPQGEPLLRRVQTAVAHWPRPSFASLAGTWLGATTRTAEPWINSMAYRAVSAAATRYGAQADAVIYLGPGEVLTASRPDPALYQCGSYRAELDRLSRLATQMGEPTDMMAQGLSQAQAGPSWFA